MYRSFKAKKATLVGKKANWEKKFLQILTMICIENKFEIFEGKWKMIIKRSKVPLRNVSIIIATCMVLHLLRLKVPNRSANEVHMQCGNHVSPSLYLLCFLKYPFPTVKSRLSCPPNLVLFNCQMFLYNDRLVIEGYIVNHKYIYVFGREFAGGILCFCNS